jgi:hypothetical protein
VPASCLHVGGTASGIDPTHPNIIIIIIIIIIIMWECADARDENLK